MRTRKHYSRLTEDERQAFIQALLALKDDGRYDQHVRIYQRATCWARRGPAFLPWHRHLLLRFEEDLRTVEPDVALPYWDFCRDRSLQSPLWDEGFMGGDGRAHDGMVIDGPFATEAGAWPLVDGGVLVRRLGRDPVASSLPTVEDLEHALNDPCYDVAPWDPASPRGFRNRIEGWVRGPALHNRVHAWVGGVMARDTAPDDPLFWLVHAFVDRLWSDWQRRHPGADTLPQGEGPPGHNLDDALWPWNGGDAPEVIEPFGTSPLSVRSRELLDHRVLGYVYDTDPGGAPGDGGVVTTYAVGEEQPTMGFGEDVPPPPDATEPAAPEGSEPKPAPPRATTMAVGEEERVAAPNPYRMTTMAVGEEAPSPPPPGDAVTPGGPGDSLATTYAVGEEGPQMTTYAMGEEGPPPATTYAMGEEGPPQMTTYAMGEEGPPQMTTYAMGEEGPPQMTTYAIGEEGPPPGMTTLAVGEEGPPPQMTTLAVGEEGPGPMVQTTREDDGDGEDGGPGQGGGGPFGSF